MLTQSELLRYSRHLLLPEIGKSGQEKLKNAKVLVIGAGGLGCPVLMYLTAAGIGKIGIVDFDKVDESNLQRQVLYDVEDIGTPKAGVAKEKLSKQNPLIEIVSIPERLTVKNALQLFSGYDVIVDGTDNFSTRYLVNDACVLSGKILVSGSIFKFQGQVSVFNFRNGPTYRCLFPTPPAAGSVPSCSEIGVLGVLPGIIGTLMANEAIKITTGIGKILSGQVLLVDSLFLNFQKIQVQRNEESSRIAPKNAEEFARSDYDLFCGTQNAASSVREISTHELAELLSSREDIQLLDVREIQEQPVVPELKDINIPLGDIEKKKDIISRDKKVIVFCRSGTRSRKAIDILSVNHGFSNLFNLKGGVVDWERTFGRKQHV